MSRLSALILDVDGTLYCQHPVRLRMLLRLAARTLVSPCETATVCRFLAAYRRAQEAMRNACHGCPDLAAEQLRLACRAARVSEASAARFVAQWMEQAPLDLLRPAMRPGLVDFLRTAKNRGLRLAVWSDYPAARKLEAMGVESFFDVVVTAQDASVQRFKPDPRGLEEIVVRLKVAKDEVIYIGDRPEVDGVAAARAGVQCLIVGRPPRREPEHWEYASDFREIMRRIDQRAIVKRVSVDSAQ